MSPHDGLNLTVHELAQAQLCTQWTNWNMQYGFGVGFCLLLKKWGKFSAEYKSWKQLCWDLAQILPFFLNLQLSMILGIQVHIIPFPMLIDRDVGSSMCPGFWSPHREFPVLGYNWPRFRVKFYVFTTLLSFPWKLLSRLGYCWKLKEVWSSLVWVSYKNQITFKSHSKKHAHSGGCEMFFYFIFGLTNKYLLKIGLQSTRMFTCCTT